MKYFALICILLGLFPFKIETVEETLRLIQYSGSIIGERMKEKDIQALRNDGTKFWDVTKLSLPNSWKPSPAILPSSLSKQEVVKSVFDHIDKDRMTKFLQEFTTKFTTRYYRSVEGRDASKYIETKIKDIIKSSNYAGIASVTRFIHPFEQFSVIARIEGSEIASNPEILIFGAHLDSISSDGKAPGADDNGSGVVNIIETFTILLKIGFIPKRTIEFHFYAGEEDGLLGSGDIANKYYWTNVKIAAMLNFDIIGYNHNNLNTIAFITDDFTSADLTQFLHNITSEYLTYKSAANKLCQRACTDHFPFFNHGYPVASPVEPEESLLAIGSYHHTSEDLLDHTVHINQVAEFTKLTVAVAYEIGEHVSENISSGTLSFNNSCYFLVILSMLFLIFT